MDERQDGYGTGEDHSLAARQFYRVLYFQRYASESMISLNNSFLIVGTSCRHRHLSIRLHWARCPTRTKHHMLRRRSARATDPRTARRQRGRHQALGVQAALLAGSAHGREPHIQARCRQRNGGLPVHARLAAVSDLESAIRESGGQPGGERNHECQWLRERDFIKFNVKHVSHCNCCVVGFAWVVRRANCGRGDRGSPWDRVDGAGHIPRGQAEETGVLEVG